MENSADDGVLKKGLLWQQRDKLFSRWKERYFILTKDYFHCFKKATSRITEMGGFIFKVSCFIIMYVVYVSWYYCRIRKKCKHFGGMKNISPTILGGGGENENNRK